MSLYGFLREAVQSLTAFMRDVTDLHNAGKQSQIQVDILVNEPVDLFNGMIVYADGILWNPGAGEGFYGYQAGAWVKL